MTRVVPGHDRRPKWRNAVFAPRPGMTDGCRVLLLLLAERMDAKGIVSVPRSKLAEKLGVDPARISERTKLARELGLLDIVRRGRPGVTAVYQALVPPAWKGAESAPTKRDSAHMRKTRQLDADSAPLAAVQHGAENSMCPGADSVPPEKGDMVRPDPTQEVVGPEVDSQPAVAPLGDKASSDKSDAASNYVFDDEAWLNGRTG